MRCGGFTASVFLGVLMRKGPFTWLDGQQRRRSERHTARSEIPAGDVGGPFICSFHMKACGLILSFGDGAWGGNQQIVDLTKIASNILFPMRR